MPGFRQIHPEMWDDPWFLDLDNKEKLLFIYLFSNPRASLSGLYDISTRTIEHHTGLNKDFIEKTLLKFQDNKKVYINDNVVFVVRMFKYHFSKSPKVLTRIRNDVDSVPDCNAKRVCISIISELLGYQYSIDTESYEDEDIDKNKEQKEDELKDEDESPPSQKNKKNDLKVNSVISKVDVFAPLPKETPENRKMFIKIRELFDDGATNKTQALYLLALRDAYGEKLFFEAAIWAASKGMTVGEAITAMDKSLPKWGQFNKSKKDDKKLGTFAEVAEYYSELEKSEDKNESK